jgi:hypothetical protein
MHRSGWLLPVTERLDLVLSAGRSLIRLRQELTPTVTIPASTQTINLVRERQSGTALGLNAAFDGTLMLTTRYGVGVCARYVRGSVDLSAARDVTVGGFQTGFGLQARF